MNVTRKKRGWLTIGAWVAVKQRRGQLPAIDVFEQVDEANGGYNSRYTGHCLHLSAHIFAHSLEGKKSQTAAVRVNKILPPLH